MRHLLNIPHILKRFAEESLFRNAVYLMLGTGVSAGFGFIFWIIAARLYSAEEIGYATALISITVLLSEASLLGLNSSIIRYLPSASVKNSVINTAMIIVGLATCISAAGYLLYALLFAPEFETLAATPSHALLFIIFMITVSLNTVTDSIFIAYRFPKYSLISYAVSGIVKIALPAFLIGFGAYGIFFSHVGYILTSFVLGLYFLWRKFGFRPALRANVDTAKEMARFSLGNYLSNFMGSVPALLLPALILHYLGSEQSAYFYMAATIAALLYTIPNSITASLFAEGSHSVKDTAAFVKNAAKFIVFLILPAILFLFLFGRYVLLIFGEEYSVNSYSPLVLLSVVGIFLSFNLIGSTILKVHRMMKELLLVNLGYMLATLGFIFFALYSSSYNSGVLGVSFALLAGQAFLTFEYLILAFLSPRTRNSFNYIFSKIGEYSFRGKEVVRCKILYLSALARNGGKPRGTVLFYPEKPKSYHILYKICHALGLKITRDPNAIAGLVIAFEDTTFRTPNPALEKLCKEREVLNAKCGDISKTRVEKIFSEVFGYGTFVDPRTYTGLYVKKGDKNAVHDGLVLDHPTEPETGYIYQKLIDGEKDGLATDIRVGLYRRSIPFIHRRYKKLSDRFDHAVNADILVPDEAFSQDELEKIFLFCEKFGLDLGDLDLVRSSSDGRIYILDANNTTTSPLRGKDMPKPEWDEYLANILRAFKKEFLKK